LDPYEPNAFQLGNHSAIQYLLVSRAHFFPGTANLNRPGLVPVGASRQSQKSWQLHVPPILAANFVERMAYLPQRMRLHRLHQRREDVLAVAGGGLQVAQALG
jgi:hypothetical protein